jgi:hypothetical protein
MPAMPQNEAIASLNKLLGICQRKPRLSPAKRRKEIALAKVEVLELVLADIRHKARETPNWARAYFSAATSVELQIEAVKADANI